MKGLQQVDLKPAAWNKLYLYDVVKIFLSDSTFFSFRYKKLYHGQKYYLLFTK